ncbi:MAG: hypothetical protein ACFE8B_14780 [Candidatus Hermodarchaeota archaeon]
MKQLNSIGLYANWGQVLYVLKAHLRKGKPRRKPKLKKINVFTNEAELKK